jgi:mRNA interferase MazF
MIPGTRPIYLAALDKQRPCVLLTRQHMAGHLAWVTIAPVTSQIRRIPTEVKIDAGAETGLNVDSAISCDNIRTVPRSALIHQIGVLPAASEQRLTVAIIRAFDLTSGR